LDFSPFSMCFDRSLLFTSRVYSYFGVLLLTARLAPLQIGFECQALEYIATAHDRREDKS
jgi:hypothetical protein